MYALVIRLHVMINRDPFKKMSELWPLANAAKQIEAW